MNLMLSDVRASVSKAVSLRWQPWKNKDVMLYFNQNDRRGFPKSRRLSGVEFRQPASEVNAKISTIISKLEKVLLLTQSENESGSEE